MSVKGLGLHVYRAHEGANVTRFTSTKVQILTPEALSQATSCAKGSSWCFQHVLSLLALLVPILTPEARADDELCDRIVVVLSKWIRSIESASPGQTFKTFETLKKALKLVFKGQEQMAECCQQVLKKKKLAVRVQKYQYYADGRVLSGGATEFAAPSTHFPSTQIQILVQEALSRLRFRC
jgi:hypothetical protein